MSREKSRRPANPRPLPPDRGSVVPVAVLVAAAVALAYAPSLSGHYFYDDNTSLLANASVRSFRPPWAPLFPPRTVTTGGRPLANLTFALNYALGGYEPAGYHAVNLLIHIAATLALFGAARRILMSPALKGRFAGDGTLAAALIAALWGLHPLQTEAVTYIIQRVESLMGLFYLLTLYFFVRSVGVEGPTQVSGFKFQVSAVAACLCCAATKEVAATAPIMVLLCDRTFFSGSFAAAWRRRWRFHLSLMATWIPLAVLVAGNGWSRGGSAGFNVGIAPWAYWLVQLKAVATYLRLSVWPHPLVFDYGSFQITVAEALPFGLVVLPLVAGTLVALRLRPAWGFLGAWFLAILAPTSIIPGYFQVIVEHRMYLSLAAVAAGAVAVCHHFGKRRGLLLLVPVAAVLALLTGERNAVYGDDEAMWRSVTEARPENSRGFNNLGNAYLHERRLDEAADCYRAAIRLDPGAMEAHGNLGNILLATGRVPEAIAELSTAARIRPREPIAHLLLGNAYRAAGLTAQAAEEFKKAAELAPRGGPGAR